MYAYLANTFHFQPERENPVQTIFGWLKQKLEVHRARAAQKRLIVDLRTLKREILEDMGVDIASLGEIQPTLARLNPYAIAINAISFRTRPITHVGSR